MAKSPATSTSKKKVTAAAITSTFASLINTNDVDGEQESAEAIVFVATAKHGCYTVVKAMLADRGLKMPLRILAKAKSESQASKHGSIVKMLSQSVAGVVDGSGGTHQSESSTSLGTHVQKKNKRNKKTHDDPLNLPPTTIFSGSRLVVAFTNRNRGSPSFDTNSSS